MSVICILVATGMRCPPQGNPEPGTAGYHNKDVRGKAGEPRLELVCGGAKAMSSTSAVHYQVVGHFVDDLCQDYGSDRNRRVDAVDITFPLSRREIKLTCFNVLNSKNRSQSQSIESDYSSTKALEKVGGGSWLAGTMMEICLVACSM